MPSRNSSESTIHRPERRDTKLSCCVIPLGKSTYDLIGDTGSLLIGSVLMGYTFFDSTISAAEIPLAVATT